MLLAITSKSITDLEDIDCSLDPMIEREVKRYQSNTEIKKEEKKDKKKEHGENKRLKETENKLLTSSGEKSRELEESKVEIAWLKEKIDESSKSQNSIEDDSSVQNFDIYSLKIEMDSTKESLAQAHAAAETSSLKVSDLLEEMKYVKNMLKEATETEMKSKITMDDLALTLKKVATDCSQAKEKLVVVKTELEATRFDSKEWKEKHEDAKKKTELFKNTSVRIRIEEDESFLAWNKKETAFMSTVKRGEDEKSLLLEQNNRLLVALFAAENQSKRAKDENQRVRDILKPVISEANVAKEAVDRAVNSKLKDSLLDKEEELQFSLKEVERVKINKAAASDNDKKSKKLLSEVEVAMEEEKHISLRKKESTQKEVEVKVLTILNIEVETLDADDSHVKASASEDVYSCYITEFLGQIRTSKQETDLEHSLMREAGLVNRVNKFDTKYLQWGNN
ncbi:WPP domain-associated protein-like [Brassica rapa]|uniref:WEB family protein n=1 Tax=Brassica campestris TaxID=3711 RepID=A0A8D9CNI3_BRACM|nr:WPP domain-associated protein-like [Brassica rapa]CAG7861875.1 unnamed protein product [Brassica rapa]